MAHDDHQTQIDRLDGELQTESSLEAAAAIQKILRRADLHRRQRNWVDALADYDQVSRVDPDNRTVLSGRAQVYLDNSQYQQALRWSELLLSVQATHLQATLIHARAARELKQYDTALADFKRGIEQMAKPTPEIYIEYATTMLASGRANAQAQAVSIIDNGAEVLGHPVSLHGFAQKIERSAGDLESALTRVEAVINRNDNLLEWQLKRIELLINLARLETARSYSIAFINKIERLPAQRQNSRAIQSLMNRHNKLMPRSP